MGNVNSHLLEEGAVVFRDEPDPNDIADWQYKDWLETQYLRELEDKRKK